MDSQGIVASICPSNSTDPSALDFGYQPAISAMVDRLARRLANPCFSPMLEIGSDSLVSCSLVEAFRGEDVGSGERVCPPCEGARRDPSTGLRRAVESQKIIRENGLQCACEVEQAAPGPAHDACVQNRSVQGIDAWCYIDTEQDPTHNEELLFSCPSGTHRNVRLLGNVPTPDTLLLLLCEPGRWSR